MADVEKRQSNVADDVTDKKSIQEADITEQENAVGYKEYREAMNLEVSDKEVGTLNKTTMNILPMAYRVSIPTDIPL